MYTMTDNQAVLDVLDSLYRAWSAGDADGIARLYAQDATVILPGVYHSGPDAVRTWFTAGFEGRLKGSRTLDESRAVRFYGDSTAVVTSQGGIILAGEDSVGPLVRATWVLTRDDGQWLIAAYHNCPVQAG